MSEWGENLDLNRELRLECVLDAVEGLRYEDIKDIPDEPIAPEFVDRVKSALPALEPDQALILNLSFVDGMDDLQIINKTRFHEEKVRRLRRTGMHALMLQFPPAFIPTEPEI